MKRSDPSPEHVVRINDSAGSGHPDTLQLRLWPGESQSIILRVVNLGDPTNLSVRADRGLGSALLPKKSNHYIILEETIELVACLPPGTDVLRGELLLKSDSGTARVPVTMISDLDSAARPEDEGLSAGFADLPHVVQEPDDRPQSHPAADAWDQDEEDDTGEDQGPSGETFGDRQADVRSGSRHPWPEHNPSPSGRFQQPEPPREASRQPSEEAPPRDDPYDRYTPPEDLFRPGRLRDNRRLLALPAVLMAALLLALALTFYTRSVPEFPGAIASSMLIVTLIIYGAATLLKA
ncbi:MAG: hypothetical protein A4E45_00185 [Methanosaeta sp. PtaB.Bin039]|nr:MAG: hypothetical protein A4E45_00185 [Methanosaeta sp. PtaB.Bin039]HOT07371.1 hypothetical protein [Methanotrichaceae archaeon]HQF17349.1 hypothetical protein [Methanotrichaceae archaeon]HQI91966.1 hypothetical protein [Methanotrichaceae archaeon]